MTGLWFAIAIFAAIGAVGLKRGRSALSRRRYASLPGRSPEKALPIRSFSEIDDVVQRAACACGGPLRQVSEGGEGGLRIARAVCEMCEDEVNLFFDLSSLHH